MSEQASKLPTVQLVYIGRRIAANGKLAYWHLPLVDGEIPGADAVGGYKPYVPGASIGAIVEITRPEDAPGEYYAKGPNGPRTVGAWTDNPDKLNEWRMQDRADTQQIAAAARAKKDLAGIPDDFTAALEVIASHFARLSHTQRAALLPVVQSRILGGRRS